MALLYRIVFRALQLSLAVLPDINYAGGFTMTHAGVLSPTISISLHSLPLYREMLSHTNHSHS